MKRLLLTALYSLAVVACSERAAESPAPAKVKTAPAAGPLAEATIDDAVMGKWSRSCALCHVDGTGGAPRLGAADEWTPRIAQGEDTLLTHTIEGYQNMPPLGYCMSCTGDELRALIRFMATGLQSGSTAASGPT